MSSFGGSCPECHTALTAEMVDTTTGEIDCPECDFNRRIPWLIREIVDLSNFPGLVSREEVVESEYDQLEVDRSGGDLALHLSWFRLVFILVGLFSLVFFAAGGAGLVLAVTADLEMGGRVALVATGVSFAPPGALGVYYAVASLVNTTTLRLRDGRLSLSFEPLPWPGASVWDAAAFDQLYCTAHGGGHNGGRVSYTVHARTLDGETLDLVEGVSNQIDALGIEKELEEALGLEDREVAGEV